MKCYRRSVFLFLLGMALGLFPLAAWATVSDAPAPGQTVAEWYLQYLQQYASSPANQAKLTTPATPAVQPPPSLPPAVTPAPGRAGAVAGKPTGAPQPSPGQDASQWYLAYLQQYQAPPGTGVAASTPPPPATPNPKPEEGSLPPVPAVDAAPAGLTAEEAQIFQWINQERLKAGKAAVELDPELTRLARLKAEDVATYDYYGHTSPTYGTPGQMLTAAGYRWAAAGETIAKAGSVYKAHALLMASSAHRQIILSEEYTRVGVGVVHYQGRPGLVVVELFARPYGS